MLPENWCNLQNRWIDAIVGKERVAMRSLVMVSFFLLRKFIVQVISTENRVKSQPPTVPGP
jgi:hypothetical protein